jgi:hypothetical protein
MIVRAITIAIATGIVAFVSAVQFEAQELWVPVGF